MLCVYNYIIHRYNGVHNQAFSILSGQNVQLRATRLVYSVFFNGHAELPVRWHLTLPCIRSGWLWFTAVT